MPQERGGQPLPLEQQLEWCWDYWEPAGVALLVLDDVIDLAPCRPVLLARPDRFRILLTTRQRVLDPNFYELSLDVLESGDALELLQRLIGHERLHADLPAAEALCEWLGYLPLGLELVGRYLAQNRRLSLAVMQERLEEAHEPLKQAALEGGYELMTAQLGVRAVFELSWAELDVEAQDVARMLSLFALAPIPWELAVSVMQEVKGGDHNIDDAGTQLDNRHLMEVVAGDADVVRLHPLIREFLHEKLTSADDSLLSWADLRRGLATVMVGIAQDITETPTQEMVLALSPAIPHLAEVAQHHTAVLDDDDRLWPFVGLGQLYQGQGLYALAEPWCQIAVDTMRADFGKVHPAVASSLSNLALLYHDQGRYEDAEPLCSQALEMTIRLLGEEHLDVALSLNNLASLYSDQGRYEEAEPLYSQALEMWKRLLGEEHPDVALSLNNLASLYGDQGRYEEAELLYSQALEMRKRLLGDEHPDVALSLSNLGVLYGDQGRYEEAELLCSQALEMRKRILGEEHPDVTSSLNNLASLYDTQGRYEEAKALYI